MTWFNTGYQYKKALTIDHTKVSGGVDLSNFPVLISRTDTDLKVSGSGGKVQNSSGFDIIFVDATETTKLDHEIERYVSTTGEIAMWVRIPTLSHTVDTVIYMYFDDSSISASQENKTGVWDANYKGVWHLPDGTTLTVADSTSHANNGTNHGATATTGEIGGGAAFNGSTQYVDTPNQAAAANFTIEAWAKTNSAAVQSVFAQADTGDDNATFYLRLNTGSGFTTAFDSYHEVTSPTITQNVWNHLCLAYDGAHLTYYVNGSQATQAAATGTPSTITNHAMIGTNGNAPGQFWSGSLDEVRWSTSARSAGWIATSYNSQSGPSTFYSVGSLIPQSTLISHDTSFRGVISKTTDHDTSFRGKVGQIARHDLAYRGVISKTARHDTVFRGNVVGFGPSSGSAALFANGIGTASFDTFRVAHYPDPSILLTPATRVANSLVNWNATTPTNTSLTVATSVDNGVTWSSVAAAGDAVPSITLQTDPIYDTFSVNSSANYTSSNGTGGSTATWTWDVANSRISVAGGSRAVLLYNGLTVTDVDMFMDIKQAQNGGMVWRYQDASNYYELVVKDSANGNTYTINKMASGTLSALASGSIVFTTGTHHYARVTMLSGVIAAYLDGTQILTYADGSPIASGSAGLRNDTGTSLIYQLRIQPQGQDVTGMYLCEQWTLTSTDPASTPQVLDTQAFVSSANVGIGTLIPKADYTDTYVSANIDDLKKQSDYWWYVSSSKDNFGNYPVSFADRTATVAPWPLDSSNKTYATIDGQKIGDVLVANLSVANSADLYRNRQKIKNAIATGTFEQSFTGNNQTRTWNVSHPFAVAPTGMTLNNQSVSIGVQGVDTGKDYYYQIGSTAITQDNSATLLQSTDTLDVPYTGSYLQDVIVNNANPSDFPGTICQTALAAIDKSSGIVTNVVDVSGQNMTVDAATTLANQLLTRYGVIGETLNFTTFRSGLTPGMQLTVYIPEMNINDVQMLVISVDATPQTSANVAGGVMWLYTVVCSTSPSLGSWVKLLSSGLAG